ncbi:putative bifunctional UDP-N-acetylglucosamine transferase and deubiquitinase ALG13 isoform X1 [Etheostoma spectabile]|uniref:putative bifunctional UDP-N-acetylglucosamine transferase and deubiquitinase ALG13 isoform X1 n=1 Tax=Etheostoma spectabile TaxID=54343 RepID=UPI0013AF2716|nr:putative bifunctional UDP-N-acetylglucosamine transferase and deubiquitinase ALG13 isoform X1 [Etheostoma spectabile]
MQKIVTESQKKYFVNMDEYLCSLGLYRKRVAQDASSLFRAVSEKLYYSQNYHQKIRQDCANFMQATRCNFEPFVEGSFEKYLERLEDPKETVGQVEIKALSQLYRHCFLIYRYPGEPAMVISEDNFVDKVTLCASNNHYDIIYPRSYLASAALCQSILYELLYTKVFGFEEVELCDAMEAFRIGGRCYRNRPSMCRDVDFGCDTPEDLCHREESKSGGASEKKLEAVIYDSKPPEEAPPSSRLSLPYKVMKSLDGKRYRNLEFDVWLDTCKEMQKTNYMVFEGRQYFLGDKCQARLEPLGKYFNGFIQEVGTQPSAVTVFIEELAEKHLVPLSDLILVKPVSAWNVADPTRKGDLDSDSRGQRRHRHRFFRKSCGMKGAKLLMPPPFYYRGPDPFALPPRFQTDPPHPLSPGAITYEPYSPLHHHHHPTRPPRNRASRRSTRFLSRHLIGPQLTYYHPGRRYYHDYENYAFSRSRRLMLNKKCQFGFPEETVEEPTYQDATMAYYQLDETSDAVFSPVPVRRPKLQEPDDTDPVVAPPSMGALPPQPENTPVCSSEEDPAEYTDEYIYFTQEQRFQPSGVYTADEPSTDQVEKPLEATCSSPSSSSCSPSSELGEVRSTVEVPPPYSYAPNGSDLPQDCRVLQYYFNLGLQWYHHQQQVYHANSQEAPYPYQHYTPYLSQEPPLHAAPPSYPETTQDLNQPPSSYPESTKAEDGHTAGHSSGPAPSFEASSSTISPAPPDSTPSSAFPYPYQPPPPPLPMLHLPYEAPPTATYLPTAPPTLAFSAHLDRAHLTHHSSYHACLPHSTHWGALQTRGHATRVYCPAPNPYHWGALQTRGHTTQVYCPGPNPSHVVGYNRVPPSHHMATHYIPPSI